jgi:hypothetical protein
MSNSKAFERILKYHDMEVQYPGILDLLYELGNGDKRIGLYHPLRLSVENKLGLEIFVTKPSAEQYYIDVCEILNKDNTQTSIVIRTKQRSMFGLDSCFEDRFFEAIKQALCKV